MAATMYEIVVIGTSWGGLSALSAIVSALPATFALPIVIVQHRSPDAPGFLAELLQTRTRLCVVEVDDKRPITPGHVFIAPPNYHLLIERGFFSLTTDAPVRYSRPSIDVTFVSAADTYGARADGVVLTGANADGSRGLKRIVDRGGLAFVQLPAIAESPTMPAAALRCVPNARALAIPEIANALTDLAANAVSKRARTSR